MCSLTVLIFVSFGLDHGTARYFTAIVATLVPYLSLGWMFQSTYLEVFKLWLEHHWSNVMGYEVCEYRYVKLNRKITNKKQQKRIASPPILWQITKRRKHFSLPKAIPNLHPQPLGRHVAPFMFQPSKLKFS